MPRLKAQVIFHSATVTVIDSRCQDPAVNPPEMAAVPGVHQLVLTRAGMFVQHLGGSARNVVVVDPTTALFFNAGDVYRTSHPSGGVHDCTILQFSFEETAAVVSASDPAAAERREAPFLHRHGPFPAKLAWLHQRLRAGLLAGAPDVSRVDEQALAILEASVACAARVRGGAGNKDAPNTRILRQHRELAAGVRECLAAAPTCPHPLAALAARFGCSSFQLARVFRQHQGVPIHQHLMQLRLSLALQHLAEGSPNLAGLALQLGFSSHSHFTELFRRTYGVPPSAARARLVAGRRPITTPLPFRQRGQIPPARASSNTRLKAAGSSIVRK